MDVMRTIAMMEEPGKEMPAETKQAVRKHAFLMLWLLLGLLAFFVMLVMFARSRRNARLRAMKSDTAKRRQAMTDAWVESGKRVEAPEPEELERDRLNLDDTDMQGSPPPEEPNGPR